jgi:hypothetical protein
MVTAKRGRIFRRKDGKFLLYLPKDLAEDSMFPFKFKDENDPSINVRVSFDLNATEPRLSVESWNVRDTEVKNS